MHESSQDITGFCTDLLCCVSRNISFVKCCGAHGNLLREGGLNFFN